ncbi:aminotransferase class I/II-fold pyridoxal phosphate-dependent enzyme [Leuconostoc mesenteroides]|uniref:trans-sulfuration enzyme family protein n=1 Tax=Leuconostoc mesenteroides TaxID=1245 RepID=UPI00123BC165|nr:aminotransferase class I/II-fold pyridoxal phosphate-dependent enzyme [Leuconostoc mesenteroides]KAA8346443.1 aminotransferase class I/II-fold pyridoxal phosphate-dependent enzyme [Leuconostoc mesenteroides]
MIYENEQNTNILYKGNKIDPNRVSDPEVMPLYLSTAHNVADLDDLQNTYDRKGYAYTRSHNANRDGIAELMTYLEQSENSVITNTGMSAISTTLLALLTSGDHVVADKTLYGESIDFLKTLSKYGILVDFVDITNLDEVASVINANTRILYTETVSNPMMTVANIKAIADLAHSHQSYLIVDNTFMTPVLFHALTDGADVVINSLTKFANGHGDVTLGSISAKAEIIEKIYNLQVLLGTTGDPFDSWLATRGIRTLDLRVKKQSSNALSLATFLENHQLISKVYYAGLKSHPQHDLAEAQFSNQYGGMLSFELKGDRQTINKFLQELNLTKYAMTLGGIRTTISHPVSSSHYDTPEEEKAKIGITDQLLRVSVGIEDEADLIHDFEYALSQIELEEGE